jgi:hypothetical protein
MRKRPGEGDLPCSNPLCGFHEVDGLGWCVRHVPDELLEEAEEATGITLCRHEGGCRASAVAGTSPPRCKNHGANLGSSGSKRASGNVVEGRVTDRIMSIMAENGERLMHPDPAPDPMTGLLGLADEMNEWKQIMRGIVAYLLSESRIRSAHGRVGEQLRAEVLIYERAIERLAALWERIIKLGIEARMAAIEDRQVTMVETALAAALTASGLDLEGQERARQVLRRELVRAVK